MFSCTAFPVAVARKICVKRILTISQQTCIVAFFRAKQEIKHIHSISIWWLCSVIIKVYIETIAAADSNGCAIRKHYTNACTAFIYFCGFL